MRRKYRFADRASAEAAQAESADIAGINSAAINAILAGNVRWLEGNHGDMSWGDDGAFYRFAAIPRRFETLILVQFHCPATGQAAHAAVYHESWLQEEIDRFAGINHQDQLQRGYRDGLYALRQLVNDLNKEAA